MFPLLPFQPFEQREPEAVADLQLAAAAGAAPVADVGCEAARVIGGVVQLGREACCVERIAKPSCEP